MALLTNRACPTESFVENFVTNFVENGRKSTKFATKEPNSPLVGQAPLSVQLSRRINAQTRPWRAFLPSDRSRSKAARDRSAVRPNAKKSRWRLPGGGHQVRISARAARLPDAEP